VVRIFKLASMRILVRPAFTGRTNPGAELLPSTPVPPVAPIGVIEESANSADKPE
jgi:hypothetical protein